MTLSSQSCCPGQKQPHECVSRPVLCSIALLIWAVTAVLCSCALCFFLNSVWVCSNCLNSVNTFMWSVWFGWHWWLALVATLNLLDLMHRMRQAMICELKTTQLIKGFLWLHRLYHLFSLSIGISISLWQLVARSSRASRHGLCSKPSSYTMSCLFAPQLNWSIPSHFHELFIRLVNVCPSVDMNAHMKVLKHIWTMKRRVTLHVLPASDLRKA